MRIDCGILSGGKSRRMGENKAFLKWKDSYILDVIAEELKQGHNVLISVDDINKYKDIGYELIEDENKDIGPIEGIRRILENSSTQYVFICATDMPFVKNEIIEYLTDFISSDYQCYIICDKEKIHPLCGIYSKAILSTIYEMIKDNDYKLMDLLNNIKTKYIDISKSCYKKEILRNINTKSQYNSLKEPIIFCVSGVKNSGKTTMILALIKEFKELGKSVGIIKHDGHDFDIDHKETDTSKFSEASADKVAIFSDSKNVIIEHKNQTNIEEMIERVSDMDVIIIEGMKNSSYPKIELVREGISKAKVCDGKTLLCVATNTEVNNIENNIVKFHINDYKSITNHIISSFSKK